MMACLSKVNLFRELGHELVMSGSHDLGGISHIDKSPMVRLASR